MERRVRTCRQEPLDRAPVISRRRLLHALNEFEQHLDKNRPHQVIARGTRFDAPADTVEDLNTWIDVDLRRLRPAL